MAGNPVAVRAERCGPQQAVRKRPPRPLDAARPRLLDGFQRVGAGAVHPKRPVFGRSVFVRAWSQAQAHSSRKADVEESGGAEGAVAQVALS